MAYNKETDFSAGYISKEHGEKLAIIRKAHGRTKRGELEWLITQAYSEVSQ